MHVRKLREWKIPVRCNVKLHSNYVGLITILIMTSSNGNISALLTLCARNSPITAEFPVQRPVTRSFDVFIDLCLNKRLSKQSWGLWSETPPHPLWRHCYLIITNGQKHTVYQSTRHMYSSESCNLTQGLLVSQWYFCKRRNKVMHSYQTWTDDMMNSVSNIAASRVFKTGTFRKHTLSRSNHG